MKNAIVEKVLTVVKQVINKGDNLDNLVKNVGNNCTEATHALAVYDNGTMNENIVTAINDAKVVGIAKGTIGTIAVGVATHIGIKGVKWIVKKVNTYRENKLSLKSA